MASSEEIARQCAAVMWETDNVSQNFGMELVSVTPGEAVMRMTIKDWMLNGHKTCHGGILFTFADSTFGFACNSYNKKVVAQLATITFIAPGFEGDVMTARAREVSIFGRNGIYDISVENQNGERVAEFRGHSRQIEGLHLDHLSGEKDNG